MIHHFTRATRHLLFWSLIATALVLSAVRIFLADIDDYQLALERKISDTIQVPLHIGKLSAGMRGFNPQVLLKDIRIEANDSQGKPAIQLKEIRLGLNLLDLMLTQNWLSSSWVTLVGMHITIIRTVDGDFIVKGIHASDEKPVWLLEGGKYEILQSEITWQDLKRQGQPVHFDQFDLLLKNHHFDQSHELHLLSNLPSVYGESLRISTKFKGNPFKADDIEGEIYLEGTDLQASALIKGDLPFGFNLQSGEGDIRLWSQWNNAQSYRVFCDIQAQQINLSKNQGQAVHLDTVEGSFAWIADAHRWRLAGYDINLFANRQRWPAGEFYLQQDANDLWSGVIKQLDLPALMHFAPLISPGDSTQAHWLALNPKGRLRDVSFFADGGFQHYALSGDFYNVGMDAYQSVPQVQHLSGRISTNDRYGQLQLTSSEVSLNAANWFRNVIDLPYLNGTLHWWQEDDGWQIFSEGLAIDSADFQTVSDLNLWLPKDDTSPQIAMRTRFGHFADIGKVPLYLPAKIMDAGAVDWLDPAFVSGQINRGEMVLDGPLNHFPFTDGSGRFETVFVIENGEIQVNEDWPHLRDVYADVQFLGEDLQVSIAEGRSEQVNIEQALVTIPRLPDSDHVYVLGQLQSRFADSLQYLLKTPIRSKVAALPGLLKGEGNTRIDVDLAIPYSETAPVGVNVNAHLQNQQLLLTPVNLKIDGIKGNLKFTADRISSDLITANTLGFPIQARFSSDQLATYLNIDGVTNTDKLEKQFTFLQNDVASGSLGYQARLTLPYDAAQVGTLTIHTDLQGVRIDSDDSLAKTAEKAIPLDLNFQFDTSNQLPLMIQYGAELQAALLIDKSANSLHSGHIVLGPGQVRRYEPAGLKLEIHQPKFNLSRAIGAFSESSSQSSWPALREVQLTSDQVSWQGQALGALQVHLQHTDQVWQGNIDSTIAKGRLSIPDQRSGNNRINLQMESLNLSAMDGLNLDAADEFVNELPLIDIDSKHLLWRSVNLGHLKLQTERLFNGIHFKTIQLRNKKGLIELSADWLKQATGTRTQVNGSLNMDGFGAFLAELGFTEDIKETIANIQFTGNWPGAPHQFSLAKLNGQLQINLQDGRISSIEPGFGRLLGLIAMEQWVKRLSLDFSDIYRQGLAFDNIDGHFKIKDGLAYTDDLVVDAVAAKFSIAGFANLADKTLDQRVAVVPKSSDALPIAGTIVNGVAAVITQVMTGDYKEGYFFGSQYQLRGPWGNVEVTPLHDKDGLINKTWHNLTDFSWIDSLTQ